MATYHIDPERRTLHGTFSRDLAPVLTIAPGDTVVYRTLDAGWGLEPPDTRRASRRRKFDAARSGTGCRARAVRPHRHPRAQRRA